MYSVFSRWASKLIDIRCNVDFGDRNVGLSADGYAYTLEGRRALKTLKDFFSVSFMHLGKRMADIETRPQNFANSVPSPSGHSHCGSHMTKQQEESSALDRQERMQSAPPLYPCMLKAGRIHCCRSPPVYIVYVFLGCCAFGSAVLFTLCLNLNSML